MTAHVRNKSHQHPATLTLSTILTTAIQQIIEMFKQQYLQKKKFRANRKIVLDLLEQDSSVLADIGITRADVKWASRLPREIDATEELQRIARGIPTRFL